MVLITIVALLLFVESVFCTINLLFIDVGFKVTLSAAFAVYSVYRRLFQKPPSRVMAILLRMGKKKNNNQMWVICFEFYSIIIWLLDNPVIY